MELNGLQRDISDPVLALKELLSTANTDTHTLSLSSPYPADNPEARQNAVRITDTAMMGSAPRLTGGGEMTA